MGQIITVARVGSGTDEDPYRPDTNEPSWQVKAERETEFDIEILD